MAKWKHGSDTAMETKVVQIDKSVHVRYHLIVIIAILVTVCVFSTAMGEAFDIRTIELGNYTYAVPLDWMLSSDDATGYKYSYGGDNAPFDGAYVYAGAAGDLSVQMNAENVESMMDSFADAFWGASKLQKQEELSDINFPAEALAFRCSKGNYMSNGEPIPAYVCLWADQDSFYTIAYINAYLYGAAAKDEFQSIISSIKSYNSVSNESSNSIDEFPTTGYTYDTSNNHYLFLAITNNSNEDVSIDVSIKYFDENGSLVGISNADEYAFAKGTKMLISGSNDIPFASYEYEITPQKEDLYVSVTGNLAIEKTVVGNKVIAGITNNCSIAARFVEYDILFLKEGNLVDTAWGFATDSDNEIKPGKTQYIEEKTSEEFDDVLIFLKGRGKKK